MKTRPLCGVDFCGPGQICACCEREYYSDESDHAALYLEEALNGTQPDE